MEVFQKSVSEELILINLAHENREKEEASFGRFNS